MSSGISTSAPVPPDTRTQNVEPGTATDGLQPWQFFVLAGLGCATALAYLAAGRGVTSIILLTVLMATAAIVGMAALRTLRPLVSSDEERVAVIGQRTRAALEREKLLTLRAIKDLEFDRAMGKLSEADWQEMSARLRARAASLIRRLDASGDYRSQIEAEVAKRLASRAEKEREASAERVICAKCSTQNDPDARFCKSCGAKL
ncbi:MAG TPA: zinc ribbon domain-containing protein [Vicinamibacterales bacterium]|nr:zinc ribbon domain-containing protein [Vicinamibacterales bacterium]